MGNFNHKRQASNQSRGSNSFGRSKYSSNQRNNRPQMHQAFCAECGNRCEVPFKPTGDKPVYCSHCFGNSPNYGSKQANNKRFDRRKDVAQMYSAICAECGETCEVPFKPTGQKPVLCSHCFGGGKPQYNKRSFDQNTDPIIEKTALEGLDRLQEEVTELSKKMDKILLLLQRKNAIKEVTIMKTDSDLTEHEVEKEEVKQVEKAEAKKSVKKSKKTTKKPATTKAKATKTKKATATKKK